MVYVRSVRPSNWVGLSEMGEEAIARAERELLARGERASVYACASRPELELVAVALSATRTAQHFHSIEIEDGDLEAAGVRLIATPGWTPVPGANALHRDLDLGEGGAGRLVRVLAARPVESGSGGDRLRRRARSERRRGSAVSGTRQRPLTDPRRLHHRQLALDRHVRSLEQSQKLLGRSLGSGGCEAEVDDAGWGRRASAEDEESEVPIERDDHAPFRCCASEEFAVGLARDRVNDVVACQAKARGAREGHVLVEEKANHAAGERRGRITSSCRTSAAYPKTALSESGVSAG